MNTKNKSNLLLIELILAILFFSITVSICVRVIFSAHELSRQSSAMTKATIAADSVISIFKESDLNVADRVMSESLGSTRREDGTWVMHFDKEFDSADSQHMRYIMTVEVEDENYLRKILIRVTDEQAEDPKLAVVYSLNTANFINGGT